MSNVADGLLVELARFYGANAVPSLVIHFGLNKLEVTEVARPGQMVSTVPSVYPCVASPIVEINGTKLLAECG